MKVLHVSPSYYPATYWGGPVYSVYRLCNVLAADPSLSLRVLTTDSAGPRVSQRVRVSSVPVREEHGYDVYFCRRNLGASNSAGLLVRLLPLVRWADVVHLTGVFSGPTLPTLAACRVAGRPLVWSPRGALNDWGAGRRQGAKERWLRLCEGLRPARTVLHCTSPKERSDVEARLPHPRTAVVPNGADVPAALPPGPGNRGKGFRLLYLGLVSPVKGLDRLVEALPLLEESVTLDVCGAPAMGYGDFFEKVRGDVERLGLSGRVKFHGFVEGEAKAAAFLGADALVVPSHSENFSNVVAEALACGLPAIVSKGAPWDRIEEKGCGLWVGNSPPELADAVRRLSRMDRGAMGARGRRWVSEEFSWEVVGKRMTEVYREIVEEPPRGR